MTTEYLRKPDGQWQKGATPHNAKDLSKLVTVGQMFGTWRVVSSTAKRVGKYIHIEVECTGCKLVDWRDFHNMKRGQSTGCNRCKGDKRRVRPKEHDYLCKRFYVAKARCTLESNPSYLDYGGRGIKFLFNSPDEYIEYVLSLPGAHKDKEIDRIDNDGNYERGNLRWTDRGTQTRNTRRNRRVTYDSKEMVWSDFVRDYTDISLPKADKLLSEGLSLEEIAHYQPRNVGRRAQNLRLAKLRTE